MKKLILLLALSICSAEAATLGEYRWASINSGDRSGPFELVLVYGTGDLYTERDWLFSVPVDGPIVGALFHYNSGADFDLAVDYLTNGINDHFQFFASFNNGGFGNGGREEALLGGTPDFQGHTITGIDIRIDELLIDYSAEQGITTYDYDISFVFLSRFLRSLLFSSLYSSFSRSGIVIG